jgi:hypothetical protein
MPTEIVEELHAAANTRKRLLELEAGSRMKQETLAARGELVRTEINEWVPGSLSDCLAHGVFQRRLVSIGVRRKQGGWS